MRKLFLMIMLALSVAGYSQNVFYDMISETVDKCFCEAVLLYANRYRVEIDNAYFPFGYKLSPLQNKYLCKNAFADDIVYVNGYNAVLFKDSIILTTSMKDYFYSLKPDNRLYWVKGRVKTSTPPRLPLLYVYTADKKWERRNLSGKHGMIPYDERSIRRHTLQDCIDFALNKSINSFISIYPVCIDRILVLDNTFGRDFFYNEYFYKRAFPYLVTSERNMTEQEYSNYYAIFGWCEILLNDKTFTIALRQVDGKSYVEKGLDGATRRKYIYDFSYSDKYNRWACCKSETIDYLYNTSTVKSY